MGYSTYQMYFYPEHPMHRIVGGVLKAVSQIAYEATVKAEDARTEEAHVRRSGKGSRVQIVNCTTPPALLCVIGRMSRKGLK